MRPQPIKKGSLRVLVRNLRMMRPEVLQALQKPSKRRVLHLHLKHEYYDAIERGEKPEEYRLASIWLPRLQGREFDEVWLYRGYPKRGTGHILKRKWNGYKLIQRQHPHFGQDPVEVLAIDVTQPITGSTRVDPRT